MVRWYSNDLKELALSMSLQGLHDSEIHQFTGISVRLLKRFCSTLHQTGGISAPPPIDNGQPRLLTAVQLKVHLQYICLRCCLTITVPLQFC